MRRFLLWILPVIMASSCSNEPPSGVKEIFYPGGKKLRQRAEFKGEKLHGLFEDYYKNGKVRVRQYYENGQLRDTSFSYYENGVLSAIQIKSKGKKQGCWKKYNKKGKLYMELCYKDNRLHGTSTTFTYRSLRLLKKLNYQHGELHGRQEYYYNSGKPKAVTHYYYGLECLGTEEWTETGKRIDNDFPVRIVEENRVAMEGVLRFKIYPRDMRADDEGFRVQVNDSTGLASRKHLLIRKDDHFLINFYLGYGGFVMENVTIAVFRKTKQGNIYIKTASFIASANNY